jgi:hypothetical protein
MVFSPTVHQVSFWYPLYLSFSTLYVIICLGGLWLMKKKAVEGYSLYLLIHQLVHLQLGNWNGFVLAFPAVITLVSWIYYRRMD